MIKITTESHLNNSLFLSMKFLMMSLYVYKEAQVLFCKLNTKQFKKEEKHPTTLETPNSPPESIKPIWKPPIEIKWL